VALTDTAIRNAKASAKPFKLFCGSGFHLLVSPAGGKLWRINYRLVARQKTLAVGAYPDVTLATACEYLLEIRKLLGSGREVLSCLPAGTGRKMPYKRSVGGMAS
jgi:hypothetical protein